MVDRVYRAPFRYWMVSILALAVAAVAMVVVVGGIPGFPHFFQAVANWRRFFAARPNQAIIFILGWAFIMCVFGYWLCKGLGDLIRPHRLHGVLEQIEEVTSIANRSFWIQISGVRHHARYDGLLYRSLTHPALAGATVDVGVGVGKRIVFVDAIKP